jgi:hypothetical protein
MRNNLDRIGVDAAQQTADLPPVEQAQLSFIVPTEHVALPSKGKFYPQSHPLYGKDTIEIKQMTAKEEDILTSRNLLKKGVAIDKLIQSIVVDKRINTDSLTIEDRGAIIIAARISAYGEEYKTAVNCPACSKNIKYTFNLLEKLDSIEGMQTIETDENGLFSIVLPATKWVLYCRALNGHDEKNLMRLAESKKNLSDGDSVLLDQIKLAVVSINGITDKSTIETAIMNMPARDSRQFRSIYQNSLNSLDMRHTFNCSSCDFTGEMEVPLTADFFWFK